jgi:cytochrome c oxidase cbb3-type subunit IV
MFRYIKEHAAAIDGISIYPVISLLIFFLFFVVLLYYVVKMDKNKVEEIRHLPLDVSGQDTETNFPNNLKQA